ASAVRSIRRIRGMERSSQRHSNAASGGNPITLGRAQPIGTQSSRMVPSAKELNLMRKKVSIALGIALGIAGLLATAAPAWAHHAFAAEFDAQKPVKLKGTV